MSYFSGYKISAIALPLILHHACTFAQSAPDNAAIEERVITPNRIGIPLRKLATSVSIVTETELQSHGNLTLLAILRQLPGVAASSSGGLGQPSALRVRGEEGFRTITLLDGIRLSDPSNPQISSQLEHLLSSVITRIELLRGPQGLSYGADAGGVLNLTTYTKQSGLHAAASTEAGGYNTQQYSGNVRGANDNADFLLSATKLKSDGFNAWLNDSRLADRDGYDNRSLHARLGVQLGSGWQTEVVHHQVDATTAFDNCYNAITFAPTNSCVASFNQHASRGALSYQDKISSHSLSYSTTQTERDSYADGSSTFATQGKLQRWEYLGSVQASSTLKLVFGGDYEQATLEQCSRSNEGYFAEALVDFTDAWFATAGMRYDDNEDFGSNTTYRVSSAYVINFTNADILKFKASIGSGFRAPSPYEIAYNRGAFAYPPASLLNLREERSRGYEAGVEYWAQSAWQVEAVYFDQQLENAINFDLANYSGYLQDLGRSTSRGVELSGKIALDEQVALQANYTYNLSKLPDGTVRLRRPKQTVNLGVNWTAQPNKFNIDAYWRWSHDAMDQNGVTRVALPSVAVLDLSANYQLAAQWQLFARIENALDRRYQEVLGYATAQRTIYAGVRWLLGSH